MLKDERKATYMLRTMSTLAAIAALTASCSSLPLVIGGDQGSGNDLHDSLLTLDSHLDTPALLVQPGFNIAHEHSHSHDFSQVDIPRMAKGGLDGGFWVIYTPQGELTQAAYQDTRDTAILRALSIHTMVASHPDVFELAFTADDVSRIAETDKKIVLLSIENSYPLGEDISLLQTFYDLGVRMVGPVHFDTNQLADSSTAPKGPRWGGLSPLGKELVEEANRLGVILDASHASDDVFDDLIELSKTPIILSHSGAKDVYDHPRNIDDERLKILAANGGVIQMNAYGAYLREIKQNPERANASGAFFAELRKRNIKTTKDYQAMLAARRGFNEKYPPADEASFEDYMDHFLHVLELIGPDHVGVGADWDGGGGVVGMEDIASLPKITERLLAEGYTEEDLEKIWGGNLIRLMRAAEDYAASVK